MRRAPTPVQSRRAARTLAALAALACAACESIAPVALPPDAGAEDAASGDA